MELKFSIGDKIDLEKIEKRLSANPEKLPEKYVSQVLDHTEDNRLFIAMPIKEGKLIPINVGQEFHATFYSRNGLCRCMLEVIGRYKKGSIFLMEVEQKTTLQKVQRREYFRFECRMEMEYRILGEYEKVVVETGNAYNTDEWQLEWKNAVMIDLSGGGAQFVSSQREEKDILIQVRFLISLDGQPEQIYAFARMLRSEKNPNKPNLYENHIKFWHMDNGLREKIIRYIFDQQRKKRSKQLG